MAAAMTVLLEHDFDSYERNSFFNVREVVPYFLIFLLPSVLVYHNMYNKFFTFIAFCHCVYFQRTCVDPAKERESNPQNVFRRIPIFW